MKKCRGFVSENGRLERHQYCPLEPCGVLRKNTSERIAVMAEISMDTRIFNYNSNKPKMNKFKDKEIINRFEIGIALRIPCA